MRACHKREERYVFFPQLSQLAYGVTALLKLSHCSNMIIIEVDTCGYGNNVGGTGWMCIDPTRFIFEFERGSFEKTQNLEFDA